MIVIFCKIGNQTVHIFSFFNRKIKLDNMAFQHKIEAGSSYKFSYVKGANLTTKKRNELKQCALENW
jgi:hypothetical protein